MAESHVDILQQMIVLKIVGLALAKSVTVPAYGTVYDILEAIRYKEGTLNFEELSNGLQ